MPGSTGAQQRSAIRGVFAWGFYQRNLMPEWASELLSWAAQAFGVVPAPGPLAAQVLAIMREVPLVLVLDGLEVIQEGPAGGQFGRLLDGTLRAVLAAAGGGWLPEAERLDLVRAVDGHALAVGVLAGALADRPPADDLQVLRAELLEAGRTDIRVSKVLRFYADRLSEDDSALVAIVGLFQRPVRSRPFSRSAVTT